MTLKYNVSGESRKQLVYAMAELLGCKPHYLKTPTYAYEVGNYNVSRDGEVSSDDNMAGSEEVAMLVKKLEERGFIAEPQPDVATILAKEPTDEPATETEPTTDEELADEPAAETEPTPDEEATSEDMPANSSTDAAADSTTEDPAAEDEPISDLVVSMPMEGFDEASLERLKTLIASKYTLLQKALGTTKTLAVGLTGDRVCFPWFHGEMDADHVKAYTHLIVQMCAMAKNSKRITAKEKATDNDKYAFRCFLLRLGFIGDDYKHMRKILLKKLDGSSAFRNGAPKDKAQEDAEQAQNAAAPAHTAPTLGEASEVQG